MKNKTIIIAEAGVNHNGNLEIAKKLVDVAALAGADYVKFQTFKAINLVTKNAKKADYQIANSDNESSSQFEMLKKLELPEQWHYELLEYATQKNIKFLSTGFDIESINFLDTLGMDFFKIPSGEITNGPLIKHIAQKKRKVILSTGMSTLEEISEALEVLLDNGCIKENIIILHCNTEYPTPFDDVNLLAMKTISERFKVIVGFSDHTIGIDVPIAAVALGAKVIEKHFTLDRNMPGPDHKASLEPKELFAMVNSIRNIERALGEINKKPTLSESRNIASARKSIIAKKNIKKGDLFTEDNLTIKRPGTGISPMKWDSIIGKHAIKDFEVDDLIIL